MLWSKTLIPTLRQTPADATVPSHQLMLRAGLVQQVTAGAYSYLPLGQRVLQKVMAVIRDEMNKSDAVEVLLPTLQPIELWEKTGRNVDYGANLFIIKDRHGRAMALGPTHEEVMTDLVRQTIQSYRELPITLYQIQTKFRDEFRPRFGVLRSREFQMKDAYSFDLTLEGLDASYQAMYDAYKRIFKRCGLSFAVVEAEAGPIGGNASHEFMIPSPTGEDTILSSDVLDELGEPNYAANVEKCETGERAHDFSADPLGDLEQVHTPDCPGIEDVCAYFKKNLKTKLKTLSMLKTLVCRDTESGQWIIAVVRGDHELNEAKLRANLGANVELADELDAKAAGFTIGFVGPHAVLNRDDAKLVVDPDAAQGGFWVTGANEADHHIKLFNWKRDLIDSLGEDNITVADIRNAVAGDPSPKNDGGTLVESKGIEVGHVFKLGQKYATALGLEVLDENQEKQTPLMGCYGIGVNRIIAAAIESDLCHDERGIIWPTAIAPYHCVITPIKYAGAAKDAADKLYAELNAAGVETILDDRDERPGVKFNDADLIGIPLRITIGDKGLANNEIEFKPRAQADAEMVTLDQATQRAIDFVNA